LCFSNDDTTRWAVYQLAGMPRDTLLHVNAVQRYVCSQCLPFVF